MSKCVAKVKHQFLKAFAGEELHQERGKATSKGLTTSKRDTEKSPFGQGVSK
jgi:hypothetical protein